MIAVIDYGASNLQSVSNALLKLNQSFEVVSDPKALSSFDKIILPGVGAARPAMEKLKSAGFDRVLPKVQVPVLGVCLGLQLFAEFSEEEDTPCLGIVPGRVRRLPPGLKIPEIGWNQVEVLKKSPLLDNIPPESYFYFVNSYYLDAPAEVVLGKTLYNVTFASVIEKDNFYAVQFHPEKSGAPGLQLLRNFCEKC